MKRTYLSSSVLAMLVGVVAAAVLGYVMLHRGTYTPSANLGKGYALTFHDEFDGTSLDTSKWNTCYDWYNAHTKGCSNYGNVESEWYKASQVTVADGSLRLQAQKQTTAGSNWKGQDQSYPYTSGMISSGSSRLDTPAKWQGDYGYYEARMLLPGGTAIWPAFWLLPTDHDWPPEIDAVETTGKQANQALFTYFWKQPTGGPAKDSQPYTSPNPLTGSWHTYAINWQPGSIDWYLDGKQVRHVESSHVPSKKMQIILNLAVGGLLPGSPDSTTPQQTTMLVDYIRVFQKR